MSIATEEAYGGLKVEDVPRATNWLTNVPEDELTPVRTPGETGIPDLRDVALHPLSALGGRPAPVLRRIIPANSESPKPPVAAFDSAV